MSGRVGESGGDRGAGAGLGGSAPSRVADRAHVAVIGPGDAAAGERAQAFEVGALLARAGAVVVCGGLGGVMEEACRGAASVRSETGAAAERAPAPDEDASAERGPAPDAAASSEAAAADPVTIGLLPGLDRAAANPFVDVAIPTGLGELRNGLVVRASDAVIAIGGAFGTLSEIGLALKAGRCVVGLGTWELARAGIHDEAIVVARNPAEAVALALAAARG